LSWTKDAGGFGIAAIDDRSGRPWTFGSIPLCTDKLGLVQVTRLVPLGGAGGLAVVAVGIRPHIQAARGTKDYMLGTSRKTLVAEGFQTKSPRVLSVVCAWDSRPRPHELVFYELGVEIQRSSAGAGSFTSVRLDYLSRGRTLHMTIPWSLRICPPTAPKGGCYPPRPDESHH
jgi:hypothetical protein